MADRRNENARQTLGNDARMSMIWLMLFGLGAIIVAAVTFVLREPDTKQAIDTPGNATITDTSSPAASGNPPEKGG